MKQWVTIAPLYGVRYIPNDVELPFDFGGGVSFEVMPDWVLSDHEVAVDVLRPRVRDLCREREIKHCLAVSYEGNALGSPDPEGSPENLQSMQDVAVLRSSHVLLALWLAKPTNLHIRQVVHAVNAEEGWVVRQLADYDGFLAHQAYAYDRHSRSDLSKARDLFHGLLALPPASTVMQALVSLRAALTQRNWATRYLVFWLVLEGLFGPDDSHETTFRISQRIALLLGETQAETRKIFALIGTSYKWRSKVLHGMRLSKLSPEESGTLMLELESITRQVVSKVLGDQKITSELNGAGRERFFDELVFGR